MRFAWIIAVIAWAAPAAAAPDVTSIAAGPWFTCASLGDGSAWCWGYNHVGQLGDGSTTDRNVPTRVAGIDDAMEVSIDAYRACARRRDGTVSCWGVIAPSSQVTKATAIPATDVVQLAGSCMRTLAGNVSCLSAAGQVVPITGLTDAVDVAAHSEAGCAVRGTGDVACWMAKDYIAHPIKVSGAARVAIAASLACALTKSGGVAICWDWGMHREEIRMRAVDSPHPPPALQMPVHPARIAGISGAHTIIGGGERVCVTTKRDATCWTNARKPSAIKASATVASVSMSHACALRGGRDIACWGSDTYGELGNAWSNARSVPTPVPGITDVVELATAYSPGTGDSQWTCARKRDDHMWCWGNTSPHNTPGGDPTPHEVKQAGAIKHLTRGMLPGVIDRKDRWVFPNRSDGTSYVFKLPPVVDAAGDCALASDGRVLCTFDHRASNDDLVGEGYVIPGIDDALQLTVGSNPACVRRRGGQVVCFEQRTLKVIKEVPDAIDLGAGAYTACAVRADHHVWCWGQNGSWLLKGDPMHQKGDSPPIEIAGLANVAALSVGRDYACALATDKTVWCWGDNRNGELGDGTVISRTRPARVPGLTNVVQISAGTQHACALLADGTVTCWGESATGQIGTYATNNIATPVAVTW